MAWHPDFSDTSGGYFAVVGDGNGDDVKEIQIYNIVLSSPLPPILTWTYKGNWGIGENKVYSCCWSPDGEYLAVAGQRKQ